MVVVVEGGGVITLGGQPYSHLLGLLPQCLSGETPGTRHRCRQQGAALKLWACLQGEVAHNPTRLGCSGPRPHTAPEVTLG